MKFKSTRNNSPLVNFSKALQASLAPDGGLYVPDYFPHFKVSELTHLNSLPELANHILSPFLEGDELSLKLKEICNEAFTFPIPLKDISPETSILELFHGPTAAFKDVGARFLAACLTQIDKRENQSKQSILVATSGDTGGAVASAFYKRKNFEVIILFPQGKVSPRQEKQLTCWGDNIQTFAVEGDFDDCQRIVKEAFTNSWFKQEKNIISANSINIGRLLPQMIYYVLASLIYFKNNRPLEGIIIPAGNLGNTVAAFWAKEIGLPLGTIAIATNANECIPKYYQSGQFNPSPTIATLANAMDVGNPSNMERLLNLYPSLDKLKKVSFAESISDLTISEIIKTGPQIENEIWCPHTATAISIRRRLNSSPWIVVATAHPAKFDSIVEPLINRKIIIPPSLESLLNRPSICTTIKPELISLKKGLLS